MIVAWKPKGMTPNEQLEILKKRYGYKKGCYAGRLDPMASGKMIYLFDYLTAYGNDYMHMNKKYEFYIVCGISTNSMDCMGKIVNINLNDENMIDNIEKIMNKIKNNGYKNYVQIMPEHSAYKAKHKITGEKKPLWYWSEKNEIENVEYPEPKCIELMKFDAEYYEKFSLKKYIEIIIEDMKSVKSFDLNLVNKIIEQWLTLYSELSSDIEIYMIKCYAKVRSGTYIRYLANMIGEDMNVPTHAYDIKRTKIYNLKK